MYTVPETPVGTRLPGILFWYFPFVRYLPSNMCRGVKKTNIHITYGIFSLSVYSGLMILFSIFVGIFFEHPLWQHFQERYFGDQAQNLVREYFLPMRVPFYGQELGNGTLVYEGTFYSEILGVLVGLFVVLRAAHAFYNKKIHKHICTYSMWDDPRNILFDFVINKLGWFKNSTNSQYNRVLLESGLQLIVVLILLKFLSLEFYFSATVISSLILFKAVFIVSMKLGLGKLSLSDQETLLTHNQQMGVIFKSYSISLSVLAIYISISYLFFFSNIIKINSDYVLNAIVFLIIFGISKLIQWSIDCNSFLKNYTNL